MEIASYGLPAIAPIKKLHLIFAVPPEGFELTWTRTPELFM